MIPNFFHNTEFVAFFPQNLHRDFFYLYIFEALKEKREKEKLKIA